MPLSSTAARGYRVTTLGRISGLAGQPYGADRSLQDRSRVHTAHEANPETARLLGHCPVAAGREGHTSVILATVPGRNWRGGYLGKLRLLPEGTSWSRCRDQKWRSTYPRKLGK